MSAAAAATADSGGGGGVRPARQRDVIAARARVKEKRVRPPSEALSLSPLYNVESVGAVVGPVTAAAAFSRTAHCWSFGWFAVGLACFLRALFFTRAAPESVSFP